MRITLLADHGQHGLLWSSVVECDLPDTAGSLSIPVDMVDRHMDEFSCGACPSATITRYRRVRGAAGGSDVELVVEDEIAVFITP